jgi:nucleotide sugar dehydrogenase
LGPTKILIIGAGTVGQANGFGFAEMGHDVSFIDTNVDRINELRRDGFTAGTEIQSLEGIDFVFLCVPTNQDVTGLLDTSHIESIWFELISQSRDLKSHCYVGIRSTVLPGTTSRLVIAYEKLVPAAERKLFLAHVPEFLREASALADFRDARVVAISAKSATALSAFSDLLRSTTRNLIEFGSYEETELLKLIHNLVNAEQITFWNQIGAMGEALRIDVRALKDITHFSAEAIFNPNYATISNRPIGGKCLPKDLEAAITFSKNLGVNTSLLEGISNFNRYLTTAKFKDS